MRLACEGVAVVLLLTTTIGEAYAHEWYDEDCCAGRDCRPARPGEIVLTDHGWFVTTTGEIYAIDDSHIRQSKDKRPHVCITYWAADDEEDRWPHASCIYLPNPDF